MEELLNFIFSSTVFMISIFSAMLVGIIVIYIIRYNGKSANRRVLNYALFMLISFIFLGIIFTYGFINSEQWNKYFIALESLFLISFFIYFSKTFMIFPNIKYKKFVKISLFSVVLVNYLLIFMRFFFSGSILINILQSFFLMFSFFIFYVFVVLFLIFFEEKNRKVLCLEWKNRRKNEA